MASAVYKVRESGKRALSQIKRVSPVHSEMRCIEVAESCALGNAVHFLVHLASPNAKIKKSRLSSKLEIYSFVIFVAWTQPCEIADTGHCAAQEPQSMHVSASITY